MLKVGSWIGALTLLALIAPNAGAATGEGATRVPVAAADALAAMGFAREATDVYMLVGGPGRAPEATEAPKYFGGASGFSAALGVGLQGRTSAFAYGCSICATEIFNSNPATENFAEVQLEVPDGAVLEFVRTWWNDTNVTHDLAFFFFEACQPGFGPGTVTQTTLATLNSTGSAGNGSSVFTLPANTFADTTACTYRVRARFGNGSLSGPGDASLQVQKIRVQWLRRVSPAPAIATFTDVPVGHPQHRFIEALVSAGITGGCAAGLYCPDATLTRGQMAVFLSVALGLNFGF